MSDRKIAAMPDDVRRYWVEQRATMQTALVNLAAGSAILDGLDDADAGVRVGRGRIQSFMSEVRAMLALADAVLSGAVGPVGAREHLKTITRLSEERRALLDDAGEFNVVAIYEPKQRQKVH